MKLFFAVFIVFFSPLIADAEKKICLTMIVKNESRIIERCLSSVENIVDCICICDTGSTDNTVEIIENYIETHQIPGKVYKQPWKNFGHNRSLSAISAQETIQELEFSLTDTYLLLLDADMQLELSPQFQKKELSADSYYVAQTLSTLKYYNIRLIKASLPWVCVGPTHEYWSCKIGANSEKLDTLSILDLGDGGCKAEKFERDVRLLLEGLNEEPDNARYMFYLAQSYQNLNQYDDAIKWYLARIEKNGWKEEVWYSHYMIGTIYDSMGLWDSALSWYLKAYQYLPSRAEPLEKLALHYRLAGQYDLAYLFAVQGSKISYPSDQMLFVSKPVYDYRFDEELSIAAYYTPYKKEGLLALKRLLVNPSTPSEVKLLALQNKSYYEQ